MDALPGCTCAKKEAMSLKKAHPKCQHVIPVLSLRFRSQELKTFLPPGLGPGSYNVKDIEQLGRVRSRKNIMISSQERFKDSMPKADVPGPGHYGSGLGYGTMLKQVHVPSSRRNRMAADTLK